MMLARWCLPMIGAVLSLCAGAAFPPLAHGRGAADYQVTVAQTRYGIPHVTARDWGSLGYGYGYALAEDNLCVLAEAMVTFRGQRSRYFGGRGTIPGESTLGNPTNLDADFFFRDVLSDEQIARFRAAQPPELEELVTGFAAGFSRYAREIRAGSRPGRHLSCRNAAWLGEISAQDVYRRLQALELAASSSRFIAAIGGAQPPGVPRAAQHASEGAPSVSALATMAGQLTQPGELGSNMIGFGREATGQAQGLLFGNPHWFWDGVDRFHQVHLKIPGKLDVEGAAIVGVPLVLIGFNHDVAWSHTVSTAARFTLYRLTLQNGDPTAYMYDGQVRHMVPRTITVEVRADDGNITKLTRTLYHSHYGPVLSGSWTRDQAYALRDVNLDNLRLFRNHMRWNQASSLEEFMRIQREEVALPFVNTIAVGRNDERAWYADVGAIPDVSDAKRELCAAASYGSQIPALDGSRSQCEWDIDVQSPQAGAFPAASLPQLTRKDYVANMNDSFWLANARAPLTGYARIIGNTDYEQSLRTRLGHIMVRERLDGSDGLQGHLATSENLRQIVLSSRNLSAELFLGDVLAKICPLGQIAVPGSAAPVDIRDVCSVLSRWNRKGNSDSVGAHAWDMFIDQLRNVPPAKQYVVPFDPAAPLDTPRGLAAEDPMVIQAFAAGVQALRASGIPPEAARGDYQYLTDAQGGHIPLSGGCTAYGYFTSICTQFDKNGATLRHNGNSYIQVVGFLPDGVEPYTLMVSSQSTDPSSPHFRDYTRAYSQKAWLRAPFTEAEVRAETIVQLHLHEVRGRRH